MLTGEKMIALNELLENIELFQEKYNQKGVKTNLQKFVILENKRKVLQLKTEKMRSLCNKLCAEVPHFKKSCKNTGELISQIEMLDHEINKNTKTLDRYQLVINSKLKNLHNLPEYDNTMNEQMITSKNSIPKNEFLNFINKTYKPSQFNKKILYLLKSQKDIIYNESDLPVTFECKNGYTFLGTAKQTEHIKQDLLKYFHENALSIVKVSVKKLNKDNSSSFFIHLNNKDWLYLENIKEFYSREFKIKYHDTSIDATKFLNQLNILFFR